MISKGWPYPSSICFAFYFTCWVLGCHQDLIIPLYNIIRIHASLQLSESVARLCSFLLMPLNGTHFSKTPYLMPFLHFMNLLVNFSHVIFRVLEFHRKSIKVQLMKWTGCCTTHFKYLINKRMDTTQYCKHLSFFFHFIQIAFNNLWRSGEKGVLEIAHVMNKKCSYCFRVFLISAYSTATTKSAKIRTTTRQHARLLRTNSAPTRQIS